MNTARFTRIAALALLALPLVACGSRPETSEAGHEEGAEAPEGPHGGRLLTDGELGIEITIYETGQEPQFRVYPYRDGKPLDPEKVQLQIVLKRLGGDTNRFAFKPQGDFLAGQGVVGEPHSFDVEVTAVVEGKRSLWAYESYEGRTTITSEAAEQGGIETEIA